ncbi:MULTISPECIES: RHS repeat-associated core domain-containing protein [Pseudomonas]|uniref:RHS repeat-associated core domain-containing protein n=1 Tax=Pseudomonas TaxID=286 RepID=UPI00353156EB
MNDVMPHGGQRTLAYSVYGYVEQRKSGLLWFNGQFLERGVQGYLLGNGYRLYSPVLMRFLSPDSFSPFAEGGCNAYAYCNGDPVNKIDPTGRAGGKTGLTKLLKTYGLPKKDLKPHLKMLTDPRMSKKSIEVVRVHEQQATTFVFSFDAGRFKATVVSEAPFGEISGHHFVKGHIYVPAPPGATYPLLQLRGFTEVDLIPDTHAILPMPSSVDPSASSSSTRGGTGGYLNLSDAISGTRQNR